MCSFCGPSLTSKSPSLLCSPSHTSTPLATTRQHYAARHRHRLTRLLTSPCSPPCTLSHSAPVLVSSATPTAVPTAPITPAHPPCPPHPLVTILYPCGCHLPYLTGHETSALCTHFIDCEHYLPLAAGQMCLAGSSA